MRHTTKNIQDAARDVCLVSPQDRHAYRPRYRRFRDEKVCPDAGKEKKLSSPDWRTSKAFRRSLGGSNVAEELNSTPDGKIAICFLSSGCGNPVPTEWL